MRAHPDNRKMKVKKIFPRFAQRDHPYAPLYTIFSSGRTTPKYLIPALAILPGLNYNTMCFCQL